MEFDMHVHSIAFFFLSSHRVFANSVLQPPRRLRLRPLGPWYVISQEMINLNLFERFDHNPCCVPYSTFLLMVMHGFRNKVSEYLRNH